MTTVVWGSIFRGVEEGKSNLVVELLKGNLDRHVEFRC
jgi:hypothetical protein